MHRGCGDKGNKGICKSRRCGGKGRRCSRVNNLHLVEMSSAMRQLWPPVPGDTLLLGAGRVLHFRSTPHASHTCPHFHDMPLLLAAFTLCFTPSRTPCLHRVYDALPPESRTAYVQLMVPEPRFNAGNGAQQAATLPSTLSTLSSLRPPSLASSSQLQQQRWKAEEEESAMALLGEGGPSCALFLAATGDQGYARRMKLGLPLLKQVWLVRNCGSVGEGVW